LEAEVSAGGRKDENFYLGDANWMWYREKKLPYKRFFWGLPGRQKLKKKKKKKN